MRGLKKALYIVINGFCGKLYLSFFIIDIPLLILEIAAINTDKVHKRIWGY